MKTGYALFALLGLGLVFDVPMWPKSSDVKPEHYSYIQLNQDDSVKAIDSYRKTLHLNNSGFYRDFFILSSQRLTSKTYVWFITSFVTLIAITLFWFKESSRYSYDFVLVFLFICIGNLFDFLILYNEPYIGYLSYNVLSVVAYGIFLIYKLWKQNTLR